MQKSDKSPVIFPVFLVFLNKIRIFCIDSKNRQDAACRLYQNFPLFPEKPPEFTLVPPEEDEDSIFWRTTVLVIKRS